MISQPSRFLPLNSGLASAALATALQSAKRHAIFTCRLSHCFPRGDEETSLPRKIVQRFRQYREYWKEGRTGERPGQKRIRVGIRLTVEECRHLPLFRQRQ